MIKMKCEQDENGFLRAIVSHPYEELGLYLELDIQSSIITCKEMLDNCKRVEAGEGLEWVGTGNAYTVTIRKDRVLIENEFAETDISCSLEDFKLTLESWNIFIRNKEEKDNSLILL